LENRNLLEAARKQLARWLRQKFQANPYTHLATDDDLIEHYFRHAEGRRDSIAKSAEKVKDENNIVVK
jgi:hypothetical protein